MYLPQQGDQNFNYWNSMFKNKGAIGCNTDENKGISVYWRNVQMYFLVFIKTKCWTIFLNSMQILVASNWFFFPNKQTFSYHQIAVFLLAHQRARSERKQCVCQAHSLECLQAQRHLPSPFAEMVSMLYISIQFSVMASATHQIRLLRAPSNRPWTPLGMEHAQLC